METHVEKNSIKSFNEEVEKQFIQEALKYNNDEIKKTAFYLGVHHTGLRKKIKKYKL